MPRSCRTPLFATLIAGLLVLPLAAVNKKNAGPAEFELKFNLPPPAPLTAEEEQKTFKLESGFRIELVASEPMIESPIAMSFDDQGRLYVVEMRGYMRDLEGTTEKEPLGRIKLLEDTDGDGKMDKATVFLDGLVMPRAVVAVNGGAIVSEPPNLYFCKDTNGDGKADTKDTIATDFATAGGQPEHMANSPTWMLDNCVWSAAYGSRFRLRGGMWQRDVGLSRGQWGLCQDNYGRLYYNYNSDFLRCDLLPAEAFARNPLLRDATSVNAKVVTDQTVWPSHPTPGVNRGYDEKTLRKDGTLSSCTATCGALVYRGNAFPQGYRGNAFIPEPAGNLLKRFVLHEKNGVVTGSNAVVGREFLTSTDERFRPVQAADGPDGALYVVDMYRGVIQHASFLTHYLIANIEARKLSTPFDQGRIWRIVPAAKEKGKDKEKPAALKAVKIPADTAGRVALLSHANGWVRDAAQRTLVESAPADAAPQLTALLQSKEATPLARLHALWTLDGIMALTPELVRDALKNADAQVRIAAIRVASRDLAPDIIAMIGEKDTLVRAHLAIKLTGLGLPDADVALAKLLASGGGAQTLVREGALSGLRGREATFAKLLADQVTEKTAASAIPVFEALARLVAFANKAQPIEELLALAAQLPKAGPAQMALLKGLGASGGSGKNAVPVKLVWLDREPEALGTLKQALTDKAAAKLLTSVAARVAWPGKPGAPEPPKIVPLNEAQTALFERGKVIYTTICAACHQPHGYGLDGLAPPLVDSEWVLAKPDVPARIVMSGLGGPIKVAGRNFNLAMPPLLQLSDEDIAGVLTYIRREWDHNGSPVDAQFVSEVRAKNAGKMMWTADELMPAKTKTK
jgi:mono/diheme cytochrome c family protein/glucose/arabinose dehydrogenase